MVRRCALPQDSRIAGRFRGADLADAYAVPMPSSEEGIQAVAQRAFGRPGPVLRTALALRDNLVRPFGVKTSSELRSRLVEADAGRIDFFPIKSLSADEIVLGEDDRHLDFRVSLLLRRTAGRRELVATTVVDCHNSFGRAYLAIITIGHGIVVRAALAKAAGLEAGALCALEGD